MVPYTKRPSPITYLKIQTFKDSSIPKSGRLNWVLHRTWSLQEWSPPTRHRGSPPPAPRFPPTALPSGTWRLARSRPGSSPPIPSGTFRYATILHPWQHFTQPISTACLQSMLVVQPQRRLHLWMFLTGPEKMLYKTRQGQAE